MNSDTPKTNAAWDAAKNQTDTNDVPDWGCVAHDMRDKCAELERENAQLRAAGNRMRETMIVGLPHHRRVPRRRGGILVRDS